MPPLKTILLVDSHADNRMTLSQIVAEKYLILEAENGQAALELLGKHTKEIAAVLLALTMPVMDGYGVLEAIGKNGDYRNLPVLVMAEEGNDESRIRALSLGAWDFIAKPYHSAIILLQLENAIDRSQLSAYKQLKYLAEYDALTGIYNKTKFFEMTRQMLDANPQEHFVFLRFDVDRFQLINSFFGTAEGDKLLMYIAKQMTDDVKKSEKATYGRIESDVVAWCMLYDQEKVENMVRQSKETLAKFNPNYDIVPSVGLYVVEDPTISVEEMYNRATLAAKTCKGNYVDFYAYYDASMSLTLASEQEITNDMNYALKNGQFEIYLQPQYNIHTNLPCGAEALVRWMHPEKGMLSPGKFIPVFERNGFITQLDYYVWEQACKYLCGRQDQGIKPYPISVNVSRVNIYNPNLVEMLLELVERYQVEPALLNLELTESAYTDNPIAMKKVMAQLQSHGFTIMMDDFGSGYSSLALLKDILVDVLKIDMRFLSQTDIPGRGENIIASVVRMAKWLKIPVIAEGAETEKQVDFLRSVGCDYVQGYYFAKPMSIQEYQELCNHSFLSTEMLRDQKWDNYHYDDLFSFNHEMKALFSNALQAAAIYEFVDDEIEMIRVNEAYYALLGHDDMLVSTTDILSLVAEEHRADLLNAFRTCVRTQDVSECEYMRRRTNGTPIWVHAKLRYAAMVGNQHIVIGELTDVTLRKELDSELQKYKASWLSNYHDIHTVLIVDDAAINRTVLKKILQGQFHFLEAENGAEAIHILRENRDRVDLILLDISMPVMDGKEFLRHKRNLPELDGIPVIMITADDSPEQQTSTFSLGANDYIIKPFIPAVVTRRVNNVLESNYRFKKMVREYNTMSAQVKTDLMTGLINRVSVEEMICQRLTAATNTCCMVMMDIDNFKKINDSYGHDYGDKVICAMANQLRLQFRKEDIIARMGGDEFAIFVENIPNAELVEKKAHQLCKRVSEITVNGEKAGISCSVGIALSSERANSFEALYQNADKALYNAKCQGRNMVSVFGEELEKGSITNWITDAQSVLEAINDSIYICNKDTYELIYVNDNLCRFAGVTRDQCKGKKCHEVLMGKTVPCEACLLPELLENKIYTRLLLVPNTSQVLFVRGKNMNLDGTMVHLGVAANITEMESINLRKRDMEHEEE